MINRILIRIKVIQILYSFLLVEKQFALEGTPTPPTKESRFAYALYIDLLLLLVEVAKSVKLRKDSPLVATRFISRLLVDETYKALAASHPDNPYNSLVKGLAAKVKESGIFKTYQKELSKDSLTADSDLWRNIFDLIIMTDPEVIALTESRQNYTLKGFERAQGMMHSTFVNFLTAQDNVREVEAALGKSLDAARDLYFRLMCLPVELTDLQERTLDENRHKFLKTEEDINPNLRFVENGLVAALRNDPRIENYLNGMSESGTVTAWPAEDPVLFRKLLDMVLASETYQDYMNAPFTDMASDCELWRDLYRKVILDNPLFLQALEDKSVFWNDDLDIISTFVLKSFRRVADVQYGDALFDKFKDEEDAAFGRELIRCLYRDKDTYRRYINEALVDGRWDKDRIAFMDIVIMMTALAEIMNFPKIPLQASMNEYIELAKSYSSPRSGTFVNGVLGGVVRRLQLEGRLLKK